MTYQILAEIGFAMSRDLVVVVVKEYVTKTIVLLHLLLMAFLAEIAGRGF